MRATLRGARLIVHLLAGLALVASVKLVPPLGRYRERLGRWWHRELMRVLKIRLSIRGQRSPGTRIIAANHVSWLDIPILGAIEPTRFVSKYEVREWPIAGWLANGAGSFYIRRGAGGTKQLTAEMSAYLKSAPRRSLVLFPEGTTTDGAYVLKFQPRLFAAAIAAECDVQPMALRYSRTAEGENIAPFIGEDDLVHHILRLLKEPSLDVEITYCAPISSHGHDRAQIAQLAHAAVATVIAPETVVPAAAAEVPQEALAA
ncbi:MAG: 1-acyl-sn-glycerol-3-phosphate acyltransferase [Nevskia sp.]|nr:1-acyl-sn-glycerol-3-phosphate acyltransferase [Nevskia sp.]